MKYNQKLYVSYVKYLSVTVGDKKMPKNAKKKRLFKKSVYKIFSVFN